jgi:hypothetical protein
MLEAKLAEAQTLKKLLEGTRLGCTRMIYLIRTPSYQGTRIGRELPMW